MKRSKDDENFLTNKMNSNGIELGTVRISGTGRIKKPKTIFDPSDNNLSRSQRSATISAANVAKITKTSPVAISSATNNTPGSKTQLDVNKNAAVVANNSNNNTTTVDVCTLCQKPEAKRGIFSKNKLVACLDCKLKRHLNCLNAGFSSLELLRKKYKCENCRTCDVCAKFNDLLIVEKSKEMKTCCNCIVSYHRDCHYPVITQDDLTDQNWKCCKCEMQAKHLEAATKPKETVNVINAVKPCEAKSKQDSDVVTVEKDDETDASSTEVESCTSSETSSFNSNQSVRCNIKKHNPKDININIKCDTSRENVKTWSVAQVAQFFSKFSPKEAWIFKDQDIDGASLLLLKRSDIVNNFDLKLGPSLRLYRLILALQTEKDDITFSWNH